MKSVRKAIVTVAKTAVLYFGSQVPMGRGDETDVDLDGFGAAQAIAKCEFPGHACGPHIAERAQSRGHLGYSSAQG